MNSAPEKGSERLHNLPEARLLPWGRAWFMNICSQPCLPSALKREGADDQVHCVTAGVLGPLGTRMIWDWLPGAFSDWQLGVRLKFLLDFAACYHMSALRPDESEEKDQGMPPPL